MSSVVLLLVGAPLQLVAVVVESAAGTVEAVTWAGALRDHPLLILVMVGVVCRFGIEFTYRWYRLHRRNLRRRC